MGNHLISEKKATIRMDFLNTEKANESHKNSYTLEACVHSFEASEFPKEALSLKERIKQYQNQVKATSNGNSLRKSRRAEGNGSRSPPNGSPTRDGGQIAPTPKPRTSSPQPKPRTSKPQTSKPQTNRSILPPATANESG